MLLRIPSIDMPSPNTPAEPLVLSLITLLSPGPGLHPATTAFPMLKHGQLPHHLFRGLHGVHKRGWFT